MQELLALLSAFVAFPTVAGAQREKAACAAWIRSTFFQRAPRKVRSGTVEQCPYLLLRHPSSRLLVFAHFDVVPAGDSQWRLSVLRGRARGRGVKDMKGCMLPFLMALSDAWRAGQDPPVSVLLTSDEEIAGSTIPVLLAEGAMRGEAVAFTPDSGSHRELVIRHKGVVWGDIRIPGRSAHAAMPWEGENPIERLHAVIASIRAVFPRVRAGAWRSTWTPTSLSAGDTQNKVPADVHMGFDLRFVAEEYARGADALRALRRVLPKGCSLTSLKVAEPLATDPRHPMIRFFRNTASRALGFTPGIGGEHGASDARFFAAAGIPAFLFGPEGGGIHGPDEWVSVRSLLRHYRMYADILDALSREERVPRKPTAPRTSRG